MIRIGSHIIDLSHIVSMKQTAGGIRFITTSGSEFFVTASFEKARAVIDYMLPEHDFVASSSADCPVCTARREKEKTRKRRQRENLKRV